MKIKCLLRFIYMFHQKMFFMSCSSIVARRRGCQLATTAPVLLFTWAIALCYELLRTSITLRAEKLETVQFCSPSHRNDLQRFQKWNSVMTNTLLLKTKIATIKMSYIGKNAI